MSKANATARKKEDSHELDSDLLTLDEMVTLELPPMGASNALEANFPEAIQKILPEYLNPSIKLHKIDVIAPKQSKSESTSGMAQSSTGTIPRRRITCSANDLRELIAVDPREICIEGLRRIKSITESIEYEGLPIEAVQTQMQMADKYWEKFFSDHTEKFCRPMALQDIESNKIMLRETDKLYTELVTKLRMRLSQITEHSIATIGLRTSRLQATENSTNELRLNKISIEQFTGSDPSKWPAFKDMFTTFFHNKANITDSAKFFHLMTYLKEGSDAHLVVEGIPRVAENYNRAWQHRCNTYDNNRKTVNDLIIIFLDMPKVIVPSRAALTNLVNRTNHMIQSLPRFEVQVQHWDPIIVPILARKLDDASIQVWNSERPQREVARLQPLLDFIVKRADGMDPEFIVTMNGAANTHTTAATSGQSNNNRPQSNTQAENNNRRKKTIKCLICSQPHGLFRCPTFLKMNIEVREQKVKALGVCDVCLHKGHTNAVCTMSKCRCGAKHNSLLCRARVEPSVNAATGNNDYEQNHNALLATISVIASDKFGNKTRARALCDSGSQINLISWDLVQRLRLPRKRSALSINGIGHCEAATRGVVELTVSSIHKSGGSETIRAYVMAKVTSKLPSAELNTAEWPHIQGLPFADPSFHIPDEIDLLLGAEFYGKIIAQGIRKGDIGTPLAQRTTFGWLIFGTISTPMKNATVLYSSIEEDDRLNDHLQRLWKIEKVPEACPRTHEQQACEDSFTANTKRDESGRYIVKMPLMTDAPKLGKSKQIAMARQLQNERRFQRNPTLKAEYVKFMREYLALGHMELVPDDEFDAENVNYIPHHAASNEKFRVVFDASTPTSTGVSLNDIQLNGEKIQPELTRTIMRFRRHKIAITADIAKMYRQVLLDESQRNLQRILWREHESEPIREYRLVTQTYGLKSASHSCIRALVQCAIDNEKEHPVASEVARNDFYVDDFLSGEDTEKEAEKLCNDMKEMLAKGGFTLAKWSSNSWYIQSQFKGEKSVVNLSLDDENSVLGLKWNVGKDFFHFNVISTTKARETKRSIVAAIAKLYDPNGFISPVVVTGKILIQDIWRSGCGWDTIVPPQIKERWQKLQNSLPELANIKIPRWIGSTKESTIEIHGFCDASQKAYGVAFYARVECGDEVRCSLISSKTRVAPIKNMTIPRLELCGAHLMAQMLEDICDAHNARSSNAVLWTDSSIVMHWLNKSPATMKTFVGNRIAEIQETTGDAKWKHVRTFDNPADLASKGIPTENLIQSSLWWNGPNWLTEPKKEWPTTKLSLTQDIVDSASNEEKPLQVLVAIAENSTPVLINSRGNILTQYSTMRKLVRITAWALRFTHNAKTKVAKDTGPISSDEYINAQNLWARHHQATHFAKEISECLKERDTKSTFQTSQINRLTPFIDNFGLMRVGGRIKRSNMTYEAMHPIIIANRCYFATLLARDAHAATMHGGTQLCAQYIREKFWILQIRGCIKGVISKCIPCFRQRKQISVHLMGQLPAARVTPGRAFESTGVDYCGPVSIKKSKDGRGKIPDKGYIAVFVCMKTRAVHLVSNLTTAAFLAAFYRFTNRRGRVHEMFSDNGTTFHGADNELDAAIQDWKQLHQSDDFQATGVKWSFITPLAANQGGIWEAAVKSAKHHLRRVIGAQQLTFEEFATVLTQVEGCLNSRPICALTDDATDSPALTPAHFLVGGPIKAPITFDYITTSSNRLDRWKLLQKTVQDFWQRWQQEYIATRISHTKWENVLPNVKVNDVVLIKLETMPPTQWPLGRITKVFPGDDKLVRNVEVLFNGSLYRRSIAKICVLPTVATMDDNSNEAGLANDEDPIIPSETVSNSVSGADMFAPALTTQTGL